MFEKAKCWKILPFRVQGRQPAIPYKRQLVSLSILPGEKRFPCLPYCRNTLIFEPVGIPKTGGYDWIRERCKQLNLLMTDMYRQIRRARISKHKFRQILRFFALDLNAVQIASLTKLNRNTINRYLRLIRQAVADFCELDSPAAIDSAPVEPSGELRPVNVDSREKLLDDIIVFGIRKNDRKISAGIVSKEIKRLFLQAVKDETNNKCVIKSDSFQMYDGIVHLGYARYFRILPIEKDCSGPGRQINEPEGFWGTAKNRLVRLKGLPKDAFYLHLKECEFRFNYYEQDLYPLLLKIIKNKIFI